MITQEKNISDKRMINDKIIIYNLINILDQVVEYAESQRCPHESTHRGGSIWEICDRCGVRWADDEGGKPINVGDPPEIIKKAYDILNNYKPTEEFKVIGLNGVWIDVKNKLPETIGFSHNTTMSKPVLVKAAHSNFSYPFVAHLHKDTGKNYKSYAVGWDDENGDRYTWINPYLDIFKIQKITHWMPLSEEATKNE